MFSIVVIFKPWGNISDRAAFHFTRFPHLTKFVRSLVIYGKGLAAETLPTALKALQPVESLFLIYELGWDNHSNRPSTSQLSWTSIPEESTALLEHKFFSQVKTFSMQSISFFPFDSDLRLNNVSPNETQSIQLILANSDALPSLVSLKILGQTSSDLLKKGIFPWFPQTAERQLSKLFLYQDHGNTRQVGRLFIESYICTDPDVFLKMHLDSLPQLQTFILRLPRLVYFSI
ncbi:hypothetical protein DL96DRAFT_1610662 [Flagelloscypha sp. PMI_526]|nr:hypothetical protein DL96DRAFT_1610662 [Flagelloscypha sp. PMI_526]